MQDHDELRSSETTLEGWKEIAAHLRREESTARRWEREEGLPVRRHGHSQRASVYAYPSEIEAWRRSRQAEPPKKSSRGLPALLVAAALALAALAVRFGPFLNPPDPLAEAAAAGEVNLRQVWAEPDVDYEGALSPDGRLLSYVHWETGDLAVRDLETGKNRLLTGKTESWGKDDDFANFSVFAPDSRRLCYTWFDDQRPEVYELRIIDAGAERPAATARTFYRHEEVSWPEPRAWFPDGKRILATLDRKDKTNILAVLGVEDGKVETLRSFEWDAISQAVLSPDGRYIAYSRSSAPDAVDSDIYVLAVDGSSEAKVVDHPAYDDVIAWTPDGQGLVFRSDRSGRVGLWIIAIADGNAAGPERALRQNTSIARTLGLGPDGSLLFATRTGDRNVYIGAVDFDSGKLLQSPALAVKTYEGHNSYPSFSPDGTSLAYLSRRANYDPRGELAPTLVIASLDGARAREFDLGIGKFGRASWSPDGESLTFGGRSAGLGQGLFVFDAASGVKRLAHRLSETTSSYSRPQWDPKGRGLYYLDYDQQELHPRFSFYDIAAGESSKLFRTAGGRAVPSPDGRLIVATERDRKAGTSRLLLRDAAGAEVRRLFEDVAPALIGLTPHWTSDGARIAFWRVDSSSRDAVLWSIRADGSGLQKTALTARNVHPLNLEELSIHPDGKRVAYSAGKTRFEIWSLENFLPANGATD